MNGLGGSELYHHELIIGLTEYKDLDITVATATEPNLDYHLWKDVIKLGVKVKLMDEVCHIRENFDLIIVSQPWPTSAVCHYYPNIPKISIIHSALRSEEAIKHPSIKHYISVQPDIYRCLKNQYRIKTKDISMIYNPIDETRFNKDADLDFDKIIYYNPTGTLIGEINDSLRRPMIEHVVSECIQNGTELVIVSNSKHDFNNKLITVVDPCYDTEKYVKHADFTVGIGGRTTIEGWMCGIPSYIYKVDPQGRILDIALKYPPKMDRFKRSIVCKQHYELYNKVLTL